MQLFNEDCISGMEKLPDNSVDLILTDLPFNLTDCAWDKAIDLSAMWQQFRRILKSCCSAVLFASGKFTYKLINSNFEQFKYKWYWVKNVKTNFCNARNRPMCQVEEILVFSDGKSAHQGKSRRRMKYFPQGLTEINKIRKNSDGGAGGIRYGISTPKSIYRFWNRRGHKKKEYCQSKTGYPSDVLEFKVEPSTKKLHPSQKPVDLLEFLIRTYTDAGETVLDATMGSGSTGVACVNSGRNFIGFELDEKFFDIAQRRINDAINLREQNLFKEAVS